MDLREGIPADPISAVDFPFPHAKMIPNNHSRHAIALEGNTLIQLLPSCENISAL